MDDLTQFNGTIGPGNLLSLVRNTAPYYFKEPFLSLARIGEAAFQPPSIHLIDMAGHPFGWLDILLSAHTLRASNDPTPAERLDYFALCMACHHSTVATFIPTDVDSKIRGVLWQQREEPRHRRRMLDFTLDAMQWDISKISARTTALSGVGPVSGHNGEMLGVLGGALGCFLKTGDAEYAEKAAEAIDAEFKREAHEFRHVLEMKDREIDLLRLASSLTHNCGDMDQGISFWSQHECYAPYRERFARLAHENKTPYGGTFQIAAHLYKHILSAEGHRHYPLREVRALRSSPDFLLPLGPFFDTWGETMGAHPALKIDERAEILAALLTGCKKIANQVGYFRAVSGMVRAIGGNLDAILKRMPAALRHELNHAEVKRHIALKQISFESSMKKRAQAVLG
jgi:hypothetical protein